MHPSLFAAATRVTLTADCPLTRLIDFEPALVAGRKTRPRDRRRGIKRFGEDNQSPRTEPPASERLTDANEYIYLEWTPGRARACTPMTEHPRRSAAANRLALLAALPAALTAGEFVLEYQPILRLPERRIIGVEALVRWDHPGQGRILPAEFLPLIDRAGLAPEFGAWILDTAMRQATQWFNEGLRLRMSVNISSRQVGSDLLDQIERALAETGLPADLLELEILEDRLVQHGQRAFRVLERLRALGVGIAVDDFGTGYAILNYLRQLPITTVKLDRSYVQNVMNSHTDQAITEMLIQLAHAIGLRVIAEGVEDANVLAYLEAHGCDECQGFFVGRPMPAAMIAVTVRGDALREDASSLAQAIENDPAEDAGTGGPA